MKTLFTFILLIPFSAFAQEEISQRRIQSIGVVFAPEYAYRSLNYDPSHRWVQDLRDQSEVAHFGCSTGAKVRFRPKRKWSIETGLLYINKGFKTRKEQLRWIDNTPTLPQTAQTIFRFKFISVPINVNYTLVSSERITLSAVAGISTNVCLSTKTKTVIGYPDGNETSHASSKQVGHSRFTLSAQLGAAVSYQISGKFSLTAEPAFSRFLTSINAHDDAKEYLYSFGIGLGAQYSL